MPLFLVFSWFSWCHWCKKLEPVWEKTAATLAQKFPGDDRLKLAKVTNPPVGHTNMPPQVSGP